MASPLHQVLKEEIVGALFRVPDDELRPEQLEPDLLANVVVAYDLARIVQLHCRGLVHVRSNQSL